MTTTQAVSEKVRADSRQTVVYRDEQSLRDDAECLHTALIPGAEVRRHEVTWPPFAEKGASKPLKTASGAWSEVATPASDNRIARTFDRSRVTTVPCSPPSAKRQPRMIPALGSAPAFMVEVDACQLDAWLEASATGRMVSVDLQREWVSESFGKAVRQVGVELTQTTTALDDIMSPIVTVAGVTLNADFARLELTHYTATMETRGGTRLERLLDDWTALDAANANHDVLATMLVMRANDQAHNEQQAANTVPGEPVPLMVEPWWYVAPWATSVPKGGVEGDVVGVDIEEMTASLQRLLHQTNRNWASCPAAVVIRPSMVLLSQDQQGVATAHVVFDLLRVVCMTSLARQLMLAVGFRVESGSKGRLIPLEERKKREPKKAKVAEADAVPTVPAVLASATKRARRRPVAVVPVAASNGGAADDDSAFEAEGEEGEIVEATPQEPEAALQAPSTQAPASRAIKGGQAPGSVSRVRAPAVAFTGW